MSAARQGMVEGGDGGLLKCVDANIRWNSEQVRWGGRWGRLWRGLAYRFHPPPIPSFLGPVELPPRQNERVGICCSGGGIRSAAFNLGALQTLQEKGELEKATYLAAVSGGSYIAAAFAMVAQTWPAPGERPQREDEKGFDDSDPALFAPGSPGAQPPFDVGSPEEQYLRNRSSYMAPDGMGKTYLAYRVVLGVLFNVLFLSAPVFGVMALLGWWVYRPSHPGLAGCSHDCSTQVPLGFWLAPAALLALSLGLGLFVLVHRSNSDELRQGMQAWSTRLLLAAGLVALLSLALPELLAWSHAARHPVKHTGEKAAVLGGGSLTALLAGALAYVRETVLTPKKALEAIEEDKSVLGTKVRTAVAYVAAVLAGPLLLLSVAALGLAFALGETKHGYATLGGLPIPVAVGLIVLAAFAGFYMVADLGSWSLHPFYKRRLATAFALKRVRARDGEGLSAGGLQKLQEAGGGATWLARPIAVERDFDRLIPLSTIPFDRTRAPRGAAPAGGDAPDAGDPAVGVAIEGHGRRWPTLLVCAAANVSDGGATPPGRRVTSFTFSPHAVGGPLVGAIDTSTLETAFGDAGLLRAGSKRRARDLTLPAAVAISGAAVAPSMGKMTRPALRFLLALANVRLGVWVPNPRWVRSMTANQSPAEQWISRRLYGRPRPSYLINELLGRNQVNARYLFVTDGGHYENLGLVELLRRGCTRIYCFDASGGRADGALGDAIALARSELRVEIDIDPSDLIPEGENGMKRVPEGKKGMALDNAVKGTITYEDGSKGVLIYARCVMTEDLPLDVKAHHEEDSSFPHNSTVDQLYTDQKFESYRKLGRNAGAHAVGLM